MTGLRFGLFGLLLLGLLAPRVSGEPARIGVESARDYVVELASEIILLLASEASFQDRAAGVTPILRRALHLEFMGRTALGVYWDRATPQQRRRYQELFAEFVVRSHARRLAKHEIHGFSVASAKSSSNGDVQVRLIVDRAERPPLILEFRVRKGANESKIIDVASDGISLMLTQVNDFAAFLQRKSLDQLLDALERKLSGDD